MKRITVTVPCEIEMEVPDDEPLWRVAEHLGERTVTSDNFRRRVDNTRYILTSIYVGEVKQENVEDDWT